MASQNNTNTPTPAAATDNNNNNSNNKTRLSVGAWESLPSRKFIDTAPGQPQQWGLPTARAVCTMVAWGDGVYVFGGFDGIRRTNEFSEYSFQNKCWYAVKGRGIPPAARDRHAAVVAGNMMYVFGGHDGDRRLGDTHAFDFVASRWLTLVSAHAPTARQSHCMVTYKPPAGQPGAERVYLFGGFDGSYRNDLHVLDLSTHQWSKVITTGNGPTPRYRSTMVCACNMLVVFGGHDGSTFLNDVYVFNPDTAIWSRIHATNLPPLPRDSHTAVAYGDSIVVFAGSSGAAMNDLHELSLTKSYTTTDGGGATTNHVPPPPALSKKTSGPPIITNRQPPESATGPAPESGGPDDSKLSDEAIIPVTTPPSPTSPQQHDSVNHHTTMVQFHATWTPLFPGGLAPHPRFCHASVLYGNSRIVVFGGFDGKNRNCDLYQLSLSAGRLGARVEVPASTIMTDLSKFVDCPDFSDVEFVVNNNQHVRGHKMLLSRVPFFAKLWSQGNGGEGSPMIEIKGIDRDTFLQVIRYAYTDECDISYKSLVTVHQAAEKFGIDRLKAICENAMLDMLDPTNASSLFAAADRHGASNLRALAFDYLISNFDQVSMTQDFEDMGRTRVDLVFELLKRRGAMQISKG